eukprot:403370245
MIWSALSLATFAGSFVTMMTSTMEEFKWSENEQLEMSLFAMIPLGLGEMLGGMIIGRIIDTYSIRTAIITCMFNLTIAIALILAFIGTYKFSVLTYFVTFFWGYQDSNLSAILNCTLGFEFESNMTPFSVYSFVQAIFVFIFMIVQSVITTRTDYFIYFSICYIYALVALLILYSFKFKPKKYDNDNIDDKNQSQNGLNEKDKTNQEETLLLEEDRII